jgi:hypothetical protein
MSRISLPPACECSPTIGVTSTPRRSASTAKACSVGSANIEIRSFSINDELSAVLYNERLAEELENDFKGDLAFCTELDPAAYRNRAATADSGTPPRGSFRRRCELTDRENTRRKHWSLAVSRPAGPLPGGATLRRRYLLLHTSRMRRTMSRTTTAEPRRGDHDSDTTHGYVASR